MHPRVVNRGDRYQRDQNDYITDERPLRFLTTYSVWSLAQVSKTRITTRPEPPPPRLLCPACQRPLVSRDTAVSGAGHKGEDRWDRFGCHHCGEFEYRHRTHRLRQVVG